MKQKTSVAELTFEADDRFKRKDFANRLTSVIETFYTFYDEAFVLSLNARYGGGKTTFLKMWGNQLKEKGHHVVYINAWDTDFEDVPIVPIVSSLLDSLTGSSVTKLKNALNTTLGAAALTANDLVGHTLGINVKDIIKEVEEDAKKRDLRLLGEDVYKEYGFKKQAYESLKLELLNFISKQDKKPIIVLVDELDRARPDYSVKFLEAIKHIFSVPGICFVLAVDRKQLEASVKQLYGDIDFENYYRRFITREAQLPELGKTDLTPFISELSGKFFDEKRTAGVSFPFAKGDQESLMRFLADVCKTFEFAPRQIVSFFRIFSQFLALAKPSNQVMRKSWVEAIIILVAVFIHDRALYESIGKGSASTDAINEYLRGLTYDSRNYTKRHIFLATMAFSLRSEPESELNRIADLVLEFDGIPFDAETLPAKRQDTVRMLSRTLGDFHDVGNRSTFQEIYDRLEEWRPFLE